MLFQNCMTFFLQNTKEEILKDANNWTILVITEFHFNNKKTDMEPGPSLGILGPVHWICYGAPSKSRSVSSHKFPLVLMGHRAFNLSK